MLLTLSKPPKSEFEFKTPHDYSPPFASSARLFSPKLHSGLPRPLPASAPSAMGTPHRGLPPPAAMTMQDPGRGPPSLPPSMGSMPAPPAQWQGAEESMRNWLMAKAEEDKRKQEEEKTRQEGLRLEQRKIEQSMLRESMQGGVPPNLVPMIFAGIGSGSLANMSLDWLQQYVAQLQASQQQLHAQAQVSPELRRETRLIGQSQPGVYGVAPQGSQPVLAATPVLPGQPLATQAQHGAFSTSAYASGSLSPNSRARAAQTSGHVGAPTSAPRPPAQSQLPRLTTDDLQAQQPPPASLGVHTLQQHSQSSQDQQPTASPSIYFHHWVPPTSQSGGTERREPPATPSGKHHASFSHHHHAASHASDADYTSSPKKRKAVGGHQQQAPPPSSTPGQYTSPSFSQISSSASTPARRGHGRARSDASTRGYEGVGGSLSRRATISSQGPPEGLAPLQEHGGPEQRQQQPPRAPESQQRQRQTSHPLQHQYHAYDQPRNDGGNGGMRGTGQGETRQSQHQHSAGPERRSAPGSPKREAGAQ